MARGHRRGISLGTILALMLTAVILLGTGAVLMRLKGSGTLKVGTVVEALQLTDLSGLRVQETPVAGKTQPGTVQWSDPQPTAKPKTAAQPTEAPAPETLTLTFGGTITVQKTIRQASYLSSSKKYDFSETLLVLSKAVQTDFFALSLENLLMAGQTPGDNVTVPEVAQMLQPAGVNAVMLGYPSVYDKGLQGIEATASALSDAGVTMLGAAAAQADAQPRILECKGIRFCILHYTESLSSAGQKKRKSDGNDWAVPLAEADRIASDIAKARQAGAELVFVSVNWGTNNKTSATSAQQKLAAQIAQAGADAIIGTGAQVVQPVVWLDGKAPDGSKRQVLCAYSLGDLLNSSRENTRVAAALLELRFVRTAGGVALDAARLRPTYIWRYQQDSVYYYRPVAADELPPDGMESAQITAMTNAYARVQKLSALDSLTLK